jgi:hypothetical protein
MQLRRETLSRTKDKYSSQSSEVLHVQALQSVGHRKPHGGRECTYPMISGSEVLLEQRLLVPKVGGSERSQGEGSDHRTRQYGRLVRRRRRAAKLCRLGCRPSAADGGQAPSTVAERRRWRSSAADAERRRWWPSLSSADGGRAQCRRWPSPVMLMAASTAGSV